LLGIPPQRKFVPTRWSITGIDEIVGKHLSGRIKKYKQIDEIIVFHNTYIGNHYEILLIPGSYQYELVECWHSDIDFSFSSDYEPHWGRKTYANNTHGAFYAGRVAVLEYLSKIRRQATILIVREIRSDYFAPVGIWQMREAVRDALNKRGEKFDLLSSAITRISQRLHCGNNWIKNSKLLFLLKNQRRIKDFFKQL
jgi:hypothetical protein